MNWKHYWQGLTSLVYPATCAVCGQVLYYNESFLCMNCYMELPRTGFHTEEENDVSRLFWGRIPFVYASAFMVFNKASLFRQIIHEIKYRHQQELAVEMGKLFGQELTGTSFQEADLIIPVPLHYSRLKKRGYNQSELIARGMAEKLGIPVISDYIIRHTVTTSQTRKSRYDRWLNVENHFIAQHPEEMQDKHILLVDDVITTGSTIEACAKCLTNIPGVTVSIASLAYTKLV